MKNNIRYWTLSIAASFILSAGLLAQEHVDVSIKVKKDGKVIKDTTYQFDDASEAKHAIKMMEVMSGDDEHMENIHYNYTTAHSGSGHSKAMVFISEDGETTEITEFSGDPKGKKVIVVKSEDGNTFDILVDEDSEELDIVKKKEVKVMVSGDEEGNWTVVESDEKMLDKDENVYILKGDDDVKVNIEKIIKEGEDGEDIKVIVITKTVDKDCDHDEDHDEDSDHDEDHDEDVDVEVKVIKKEKK